MMVIIGADLFSSARLNTQHLLFNRDQQSDAIVIVAIDDASLQSFGRAPTDWTRDEYIPVIDALAQAQARVIAIDLLLPEPAPGDIALAAAIERARLSDARTRFVLAASGGGSVRPATLPDQSAATRFQGRLIPVEPLLRVADYVGYTNTLIDPSGSQCCQLSYITIGDQINLSFSIATYLAYLRIPNTARAEVLYNQDNMLFVTPERSLKVDAFGQWRQNYNAPAGRGFPTLSFIDVHSSEADLSIVRDRIVLIGLHNAAGAVDTYRVPGSPDSHEMSGVEIQANAIETLLQDNALQMLTRLQTLLWITGISFVSMAIYERVRWFSRPLVFLCLIILLVAAASFALSVQHTLFPLFDGALALALPLIASLGLYVQEQSRLRTLAEYATGIAEREKRLLEDVILGTPAPTIILNRDLAVTTVNHAFTSLLDTPIQRSSVPCENFLDLLEKEDLVQQYLDELRTRFQKELDFQTQLEFRDHRYQFAANWLPRLNRWIVAWADVSILAEMNEIKRHMLLMVSHDLRNPLSSLHLQLYQIKRMTADTQPSVTKTIEAAELSAKTMQHILSDVIDLEQVRSLAFPTTLLDMEAISRTVIERYRHDAQQKQHTLALKVTPPIGQIRATEGHITQMIANLVSNAIKYTPVGGTIDVRLHMVQDTRIRIEVSDNGIGIPKDAQGNLFVEFYRVRSRATSEIPGTGLGLSLAKTIVRKNGGQIWFESQEGIGTTFYVEFPCALVQQTIS
jgi:signal transduction histidine kinase/CHASE2 domain-containing sensor protein